MVTSTKNTTKTVTLFYQQPRFVNHIDDKARETIVKIYGALLSAGHVLTIAISKKHSTRFYDN